MRVPGGVTLGLLAGGRATRLGGIDKAWLQRDGIPQVQRWQRRFGSEVDAILASSNGDSEPYAALGIEVVADRLRDAGPLGGIDALADACRTRWLLTLPVDLVGVNECLLPSLLSAAGDTGSFARDGDGPQPLVALWGVDALRVAASAALRDGSLAVHALQARLGMREVRFEGVRYGNLNTPAELQAAGVRAP
ncbi:MAG: molybdenum cofactor guanylyltransferase [Pseudomonadota bacterium]|nr:molybdenum cofactor guanylyltransferase [Pseudomonadota bacterium]